jgi:hypothetical protein
MRRFFGKTVADPKATSSTPVIALFAMTALMAHGGKPCSLWHTLHAARRRALLHYVDKGRFLAFMSAGSGSNAEQLVDEAELALCAWFFESLTEKEVE